MTDSAHSTSQQHFVCFICARPIALETSKTDECGKAVHEDCYVRKTISIRMTSPVHPRENGLNSILSRFQLRHRVGATPSEAKEWLLRRNNDA